MISYVAVRPLKLNGKEYGVNDTVTDVDIGNEVLEKRLLNIRKIAPDPQYATGVQRYVVTEGQGFTYAGKQYCYGDTITSAEIESPVRERQMVAARRIKPVYGDLSEEEAETQESPRVEFVPPKQRGRPRKAVH